MSVEVKRATLVEEEYSDEDTNSDGESSVYATNEHEEHNANVESDEGEDLNDTFHSPTGSQTSSPKLQTRDLIASPSVSEQDSAGHDSSPLSLSHEPTMRIGTIPRSTSPSLMDEVDMLDETPAASTRSRSSTSSSTHASKPPLVHPPRHSSKMSWASAPASIPEKSEKASTATPPVIPQARRSPFSFFSRVSSNSVPQAASPPTMSSSSSMTSLFSGRRNTTSSTTTANSNLTTPTAASGNALPSIFGSINSSYLSKPSVGQDLIQQRVEATKDNHQHANASQQEEASKGVDSLRANFKKLREGAVHEGDDEKPVSPTEKSSTEIDAAVEAAIETPPAQEEEIDWEFWSSVVEDYYSVATKSTKLLTEHIQAGIPQTIRGTVWQAIAQSKTDSLEAVYKELNALPGSFTTSIAVEKPPTSLLPSEPSKSPTECKTVSQLEKEIKKDMGQRTSFAGYKGFRQEGLMGLMKAYAVYDPEVGYVQGMAFMGAPLLLNMSEEEAFCLLTELMRTYSLRDMFTSGMKGLHLRLYQYDRLLEDLLPTLSVHLSRRKAESKLYATQWFLTLFAYKFPLQLVLRVYDLIISEGIEGAILKFGIALMKKNEDALRSIDSLEILLPFLREKLFDAYIDHSPSANSLKEAGFFGNGGETQVYRANDLVKDACEINITPEMLHQYTLEWVEMDKRETEELIEKETLRSQNIKLNSKVRQMNQEFQDLTREHVNVATELVHKKMQTTQLIDENEGLKIEVDELRERVEKQPKEIEAKLKDEMDRIMKRNLEVHNENQSLEDQMREMEMELVDTKMQLAEINEQHELLKTRWNDLRKALGD